MDVPTGLDPPTARAPFSGYSVEHRPLAGYAILTAAFGASVAGASALARAAGREPPEGVRAGDVVMLGVATHKVSRMIAKDRVTSFMRAPFTRYQEASGQGEVEEEPRGRGLRLAVGELLVCPYCLGQWVSASLAASFVLAPRATRVVAASYTAQTIADFLQLAYLAGEKRA
jgi:hypothetical protein